MVIQHLLQRTAKKRCPHSTFWWPVKFCFAVSEGQISGLLQIRDLVT